MSTTFGGRSTGAQPTGAAPVVSSLAMAEHELSQAAHDRLAAELEDLRTRGRIDLADRIERAREHGDLKENAEYHAAKDEKAKMESRIATIAQTLEDAVVVEVTASEEVGTGSVVSIRYDGDGDDEIEKYLVGSIEERHDDLDVVSPSSPLGAALMGHVSGDQVSFEAHGNEQLVEIVAID